MPSLLTSSSLPGRRQGLGLSRVTSLQRKWDDDDDEGTSNENIWPMPLPPHHQSSSQPQASSSAISWSPSPERVRRKVVPLMPTSTVSEPVMIPGETPADRRRRAILAAMSQSSDNSKESSSASTSYLSKPLRSGSSRPSPSVGSDGLQVLPSLKRSRPWDEGVNIGKKVAEQGRTVSRTNSSMSSSSTKGVATVGPSVVVRPKIFLSQEQKKVLQLVEAGKNVFFTGSAGTGKSVLLREIIKTLRRKHAKASDAVAVTASTGIAACNIGGVTLHSFGGCGLALEPAPELVTKIRRNKKAVSRWTRTKVLIIDEVSMVDGELFDKFNKVGQLLRRKPSEPWGGIQIIVTGDFFQLPPVSKGREPNFCFEASSWESTIDISVNLTQVFRQSDERFINMLNEMRFGRLTQASIQAFKELERPIFYDDGISATELFPRREDVERSNNQRLEALNTDGWSYESVDGGVIKDPVQREKMLANFMAPSQIFLKVDAQVMLIKNVDETLVNGSMGKVIGFCHRVEYVQDSSGRWREGGVLEDMENEDDDDDTRAKLMENLRSKISANAKPFPVVRFNVPGGQRDMLVEADSFKNELPNGEVQVSRQQIPLILAWAMSIHKAQGQTLDRVKVDLSKVFEKGQAYVALSRATTLDGLEVKGFKAEKVMVHRKVAVWNNKLQTLGG